MANNVHLHSSTNLFAVVFLVHAAFTVFGSVPHPFQGELLSHNTPEENDLGSWGYTEVRPGAHTFWWLFPKSGSPKLDTTAPLVLWIQGGPGASSVGYGNFAEMGPFEIGWKPRKHSWASAVNLLFVDNPVGTGFSYVEEGAAFATDNNMIAVDLLTFLRAFLEEQPRAAHTPFFIFCESYGGKMGIKLAEEIGKAQAAGSLDLDFRGIALGDSWISPVDYVLSWGPFLKAWSLLDDHQLRDLTPMLLATQNAVQVGNLTGATELWGKVEGKISNLTDNVDWYNALRHNIPDNDNAALWASSKQTGPHARLLPAQSRLLARHHEDPLTEFMRGPVTKALGIIPEHVTWGKQAGKVFEQLAGDFMVDSIPAVAAVLKSGMNVSIYNGQLDLICCTLGLDAWLPSLKWDGLEAFQAAPMRPVYAEDDEGRRATTGFVRRHRNLALHIILNAGHMIPADQPEAALALLAAITGLHDKSSRSSGRTIIS